MSPKNEVKLSEHHRSARMGAFSSLTEARTVRGIYNELIAWQGTLL
jgi:hypothetical protein